MSPSQRHDLVRVKREKNVHEVFQRLSHLRKRSDVL